MELIRYRSSILLSALLLSALSSGLASRDLVNSICAVIDNDLRLLPDCDGVCVCNTLDGLYICCCDVLGVPMLSTTGRVEAIGSVVDGCDNCMGDAGSSNEAEADGVDAKS